ncbi:hypothetical protein [Streptomyces sp. NPDC059009]|uniref:hypothetical protein n=1 Tax=Streptomyces sp. NPDC059009 TaxID=3346694 RepID=UPI0036D170A3
MPYDTAVPARRAHLTHDTYTFTCACCGHTWREEFAVDDDGVLRVSSSDVPGCGEPVLALPVCARCGAIRLRTTVWAG